MQIQPVELENAMMFINFIVCIDLFEQLRGAGFCISNDLFNRNNEIELVLHCNVFRIEILAITFLILFFGKSSNGSEFSLNVIFHDT